MVAQNPRFFPASDLEAVQRLCEVVVQPLPLQPPLPLLAARGRRGCGVHVVQVLGRVLGQLARVVLDLVQLLLELLVVLEKRKGQ